MCNEIYKIRFKRVFMSVDNNYLVYDVALSYWA